MKFFSGLLSGDTADEANENPCKPPSVSHRAFRQGPQWHHAVRRDDEVVDTGLRPVADSFEVQPVCQREIGGWCEGVVLNVAGHASAPNLRSVSLSVSVVHHLMPCLSHHMA